MNAFKAIEQRLDKLVSTDTSLNAKQELPLAILIDNEFKKNNIPSMVYRSKVNKENVCAQISGRHPEKLLIHTHLDTEREMIGSPIALVKKKNNYFGRGTLDCKGPIAIWMQVLIDLFAKFGKPKYSIAFVSVADEESGGRYGTEWMMNNTNCFDNTFLAIGEGGGYPVSGIDKTYFTFQTGEIEKHSTAIDQSPEKTIKSAISKGYYNESTLEYYKSSMKSAVGRSVDVKTFYEGVLHFLKKHKGTSILENYLPLFRKILKSFNFNYDLLPVISPGYSDNRFFRQCKIDTIGFFPIHPNNYVGGIHGKYECITADTIAFSYQYCKKLIQDIAYCQ